MLRATPELRILTNFTLATRDQSGYTPLGNLKNQKRNGNLGVIRTLKRIVVLCALVLPAGIWTSFANAAPDTPQPAASSDLHIELNKLETSDKGCRAYVVINNAAETTYQSYKIDLVLFQTDGIIGKRFSIDLAPLKAKKKLVKLFEIDGIQCDKIGSFLVNDVMECKADGGPVTGCLEGLKTSTLTNVQLSK